MQILTSSSPPPRGVNGCVRIRPPGRAQTLQGKKPVAGWGRRKVSGSQAAFIHWCVCPKTSLGPSRPPFPSEVLVRRSTPQDQHPHPATSGRTPPPPSLGSVSAEHPAPTVAFGWGEVRLETSPEPLEGPFCFRRVSHLWNCKFRQWTLWIQRFWAKPVRLEWTASFSSVAGLIYAIWHTSIGDGQSLILESSATGSTPVTQGAVASQTVRWWTEYVSTPWSLRDDIPASPSSMPISGQIPGRGAWCAACGCPLGEPRLEVQEEPPEQPRGSGSMENPRLCFLNHREIA